MLLLMLLLCYCWPRCGEEHRTVQVAADDHPRLLGQRWKGLRATLHRWRFFNWYNKTNHLRSLSSYNNFSATQILWKIMASHWLNWNFSTAPCSTDSLRKTFPPAYWWRMFVWQGCASQLRKCSWTVQFGKIDRSLRRVASSIFISLTWHCVLMQSFLLPLTYRLKKGVKDKLIHILNLANWVGG